MLILPAIDILGGAAVRLTKGDYATKKIYDTNPLSVAKEFEAQGAKMLHVVDLDGAKEGKPVNRDTILAITRGVSIPVEVGGGIRTHEMAREYLNAGVARVVLSTKALTEPSLIRSLIEEFGSERIIVGIEIKGRSVAIEGWKATTGRSYKDFAKELKALGVTTVLFTDIERDGTLTEPNYDVARELTEMGFSVIASGGISDTSAIKRLKELGVSAAIIGKALYEGKLTLNEAQAAAQPASGLARRVIPCLDVKNGKVVKGVSFENLQDVGDPVALGKKYSEDGADELVFLDISASREGRETMFELVEKVAKEVFIPFTVGGGISSIEQMRKLLQLGAEKVSINTAAVKNPQLISDAVAAFGQQAVVVAIDAKKKGDRWEVFLKGGSEPTGINAIEWAKEAARRGAGEILLTSMDKDGTRAGYDTALLRAVSYATPIPIVASGGAGSLEDMRQALVEGRADAALVASLFHYGEYSVKDAKEYLANAGVPVRI